MNMSKIAVIGTSVLLVLIVPLFTRCSGEYGVKNNLANAEKNISEKNLTRTLKVINNRLPKKALKKVSFEELHNNDLVEIKSLTNSNHKLKAENKNLSDEIKSLNVSYDSTNSEYNANIAKYVSRDKQIVGELDKLTKENQIVLQKNMGLNETLVSLKQINIEKSYLKNAASSSALIALAAAKKEAAKNAIELEEVRYELTDYKRLLKKSQNKYALLNKDIQLVKDNNETAEDATKIEPVVVKESDANETTKESTPVEKIGVIDDVSPKQLVAEKVENPNGLVLDGIVALMKESKIEFKTSSVELTDDSKVLLDQVAGIMSKNSKNSYRVQGHTDSSGYEDDNLKLSLDRAKRVSAYLVSKGVSKDKLSPEGLGSSKPIASNNILKGREQNRRVVFVIN